MRLLCRAAPKLTRILCISSLACWVERAFVYAWVMAVGRLQVGAGLCLIGRREFFGICVGWKFENKKVFEIL